MTKFSCAARLLTIAVLLAPLHHAHAQATLLSIPIALAAGLTAGQAAAAPSLPAIGAAVASGDSASGAAAAAAAIFAAAAAAQAAAAAAMVAGAVQK